MKAEKPLEIAVDFDGTCVAHHYPSIGQDIGAVPVLKKLVEKGHKLILFTMRCDTSEDRHAHDGYKMYGGNYLTQAINWFKKNNIELYGAQYNPSQKDWTKSNKCYANLYIDDAALGIPLKLDKSISDRPFVDWEKVEQLLIERKIL